MCSDDGCCSCCGELSTGARVCIVIGSIIGAIIFAALLGSSFAILEYYQIGLAYNANTARVDLSRVYTSGRYALGPGISFVTFPATMQTISDTIPTRSQDGVAVSIDISYQYRIVPDELPQMYTEQGILYEQNIVRIARFVLRDAASNYTATQFFTKRVEIGQVMLNLLQTNIRPLHFQVLFFQLRDIVLPTVFENSIVTAEVARQNIQITQFQQSAARVRQETDVRVADTTAAIQVITAQAAASAFLIEAQAQASATSVRQSAQSQAYAYLKSQLNLNTTQLLAYLWTQAIQAHNTDKLVIGTDQPQSTRVS